MITYAILKDLMEPDEFVIALERMNKTTGHTNTAKRVARNIYVLNLLRLVGGLTSGDTGYSDNPITVTSFLATKMIFYVIRK